MKWLVRPELPTAALRSSQATLAAVDNSAPFVNRPQSTYKSGNVVQTSGATSADDVVRNVVYGLDMISVIFPPDALHL